MNSQGVGSGSGRVGSARTRLERASKTIVEETIEVGNILGWGLNKCQKVTFLDGDEEENLGGDTIQLWRRVMRSGDDGLLIDTRSQLPCNTHFEFLFCCRSN